MALAPVLGALLLALLAADVFVTVFQAAGHAGPLTRRHSRALWALFRRLGVGPNGPRYPRLLASAAPVLVVSTLGVWVGGFVLAFALVYLPFVPAFEATAGPPGAPWAEALYVSVETFATLGLGHLVPHTPALRLVGGVQALVGFGVFTLGVTYLLEVYSALIATRATAGRIAGYFAEGAEATLGRVAEAGADAFGSWADGVAQALLHAVQAQHQYPVLHFFRATDRAHALPVQVGHLLDARRLLGAPGRPEALASTAAHPSAQALFRAAEAYLSEVGRHFVPETFETGADGAGGAAARARLLRYAGYEA